MNVITRWVVSLVVLGAGLVVLAGPARASCAALPPLEQALADADHIFTGRVIALEAGGAIAVVDVHEVWKGSAESEVRVVGGQIDTDPNDGLSVASSVDRGFNVGEDYLFVPWTLRKGLYRDNICTATRVLSAEVEALRPSSATTPGAGGGAEVVGPPLVDPADDNVLRVVFLGGGMVLAVAALVAVLFRKT